MLTVCARTWKTSPSTRVDRNIALARAIGVTGTPTFIVGDAMLVGVKPLEQMESAIADARPARLLPSPPSVPNQ
jgi:predicted DsbA family dithiol-disulfide isomerase